MTSKYIAGPSPKYEPYPVNLHTISGFLMKNEQTSHVDVPNAGRGPLLHLHGAERRSGRLRLLLPLGRDSIEKTIA